jgi:hypothetical protein
MKPFAIQSRVGGSPVTKRAKAKKKGGARRKAYYIIAGGKRIRTTERGYRAHRAVVRALKGVDVPPP